MQIYVQKNGQQLGPFTEADVQSQLAAGAFSPQDLAWWEGQAGWTPLAQTRFLGIAGTPLPAPAPGMAMTPAGASVDPGARTSGMAIAALVCGILGFLYLFPAIAAIIMGHLSRDKIMRDPLLRGRGMALAGLILGYFWIAAFFAFVGLCMLFMLSLGGMAHSNHLQQAQGS